MASAIFFCGPDMHDRRNRSTRIRRSKRRDSTRSTAQLILEEAESLIAEHGVDGLRLAVISERLGVTQAALYEHYPGGRRHIVERVAMAAAEGLAHSFAESGADPREQLIRGVCGLVQYLSAHPAHMRVLLRDFSLPEGLPELTRQIGLPGEAAKAGLLRPMHQRLDRLLRHMPDRAPVRRITSQLFFNVLVGATCLSIVYPPYGALSSASKRLTAAEDAMVDLALTYVNADGDPKVRIR
jgi:AcrR family transcriptional regulator